MSFRIRQHELKKPIYSHNESKQEILDKEGKPVLDEEGNPTYKVVKVLSGSASDDVKKHMSNKLGHPVSSSMQIRTSDQTANCDYF
jgi:hypothetical protein